jgi:hypothetical protein
MPLLVIVFTASIIIVVAGCNGAGTAQSMVEIPAGWKQFSSDDFELYLPGQWEGGSEEELQSIIAALRQEGQTLLADQVESGIPYLSFWGYDSETASPDTPTNLSIGSESASFTSLEQYMELGYEQMADTYEQFGYTFSILEQDVVQLGSHKEVGRTLVSEEVAGNEIRMARYIMKSGSDFWIISFTVSPEDLNQYMETFDKIVETFTVR